MNFEQLVDRVLRANFPLSVNCDRILGRQLFEKFLIQFIENIWKILINMNDIYAQLDD